MINSFYSFVSRKWSILYKRNKIYRKKLLTFNEYSILFTSSLSQCRHFQNLQIENALQFIYFACFYSFIHIYNKILTLELQYKPLYFLNGIEISRLFYHDNTNEWNISHVYLTLPCWNSIWYSFNAYHVLKKISIFFCFKGLNCIKQTAVLVVQLLYSFFVFIHS